MRVSFIPPSEEEFRKLFQSHPMRKGGGLDDISVFYPGRRRGGSILSAMSGIARRVIPFLFRAVKPSVKEFGRGVLTDMITNERPLKESLKNHGIRAVKSTGARLLKGSGRVRKRKKTTSGRGDVRKKGSRKGKVATYKNDVYGLL